MQDTIIKKTNKTEAVQSPSTFNFILVSLLITTQQNKCNIFLIE